MRKLFVPDVFATRSAAEFVQALVDRNCGDAAPKPQSRRAFAERLGWSSGFLTDVLKGRKALSIPRAAQLALDCRLNNFGRERLILLSAYGLLPPKQRARFKELAAPKYEGRSEAFSLEVFAQSQLMTLYNLSGAFPRRLPAATIKRLVPVLSHLDELQIDTALRRLEALGFVAFDGDKVTAKPAFWQHGDEGGGYASHVPYLRNLIRFCEKPWAGGFLHTAQMSLPKAVFPEIMGFIKDVIRRVFEAATALESADPTTEQGVYQMDLNVIELLDPTVEAEVRAGAHLG